MAAAGKSIYSYLLGACVEWILIVMLLINSLYAYVIFRFANYFGLKEPCLCCSSYALIKSADLVCRLHVSRLGSDDVSCKLLMIRKPGVVEQNSGYAGGGDGGDDGKRKSELERRSDGRLRQRNLIVYNYYDDVDDGCLKDLVEAVENKSTKFIRDLYSNENVVEFTFTEDDDEYVQKHIVHDDDRLNWRKRSTFSEAEPRLIIDDFSSGCLEHGDECAGGAVAIVEERELETKGTLIKHIKVNDDEGYSIAYTAEGDLVMDLCRNSVFTKPFSTAYDTVDLIPPTSEQQGDEPSHQARGEFLALHNNENAERILELENEERQHPEKSLVNSITENVHEHIDEKARSINPSPPSWTEDHVHEQAEETSIQASVDLPASEQMSKSNGGGLSYASSDSPLPLNVEELSEFQVERFQEQTPSPLLPLSTKDNSKFSLIDNRGSDQVEETVALGESNSVEETQHPLTINLGLIKIEEDKLPDTPSSFDGAHNIYRNWLLSGKDSATEETLDGSIISEFEFGEGILTINKLKTALQVERKALHALYAELEEERNASAVAASQTMAMINRLQEEKASVQMEALQYQRMMEEQSEYDQEALQLLNELMVKREKEKQELEKELEIYRKRVINYETKERLMMLNRKEESHRNGSSISFSNADESDIKSIDLKVKHMNGFVGKEENGNDNTPLDDVLHTEDTFSHFEEERLSILEQLKVLEENLFTLDDVDDDFSCNHDSNFIMNGTENGCHNDVKGSHYQERRFLGPKGKTLLPLFDATVDGNGKGELSRNENENDFTSYPHSSSSFSEPENKNIFFEEEVDNVYERLQILEADNEFLRHCFSSLKRGEKGLELLQEILQHLRDLRSVKLDVLK